MDELLALIAKQAEDEGLWFDAQTAPEAYLQRHLRELHRAVEKALKEKWTHVNDKLPEENQRVIYWFSSTGMGLGTFWITEEGLNCFGGPLGWLCDDVTKWMPAPDEPE
jgi:hypothetical protein